MWAKVVGERACRSAIHQAEETQKEVRDANAARWKEVKTMVPTILAGAPVARDAGTVVCTRKGLEIIREVEGGPKVVQIIEFPKIKDLLLVSTFGTMDPKKLMDTMLTKHQPCIAGVREIDGAAAQPMVYTTKGSVLALKRGSVVVVPPRRKGVMANRDCQRDGRHRAGGAWLSRQ